MDRRTTPWALVLLSLCASARAGDIASGRHSGILAPLETEVGSSEDWEKLWERHDAGRGLARPEVDFSKDRVLASFSGGPDRSFSMRAAPKITLSAQVHNDYLIPPAGLLGLLSPGTTRLDGDDFGYTHGAESSAGLTDARGLTWSLRAATDLYTKAAGLRTDSRYPILFTERDVFSLGVDNLARGDGFKWKASTGVQFLVSGRTTAGATGQQIVFHKTATAGGSQNQYAYEEDGRGPRRSVYIGGALGYAKTLVATGRLKAASLAYLEPLVFTRLDSSVLKLHGELGASLKTGPARASLVAGADLTLHRAGLESTPTVALAYDRPRWGVESKVHFPSGELRNDVVYNWDKSPYASLGVRTTLGDDKPVKRPFPGAHKPPPAAY